jgi:hypothetical protein
MPSQPQPQLWPRFLRTALASLAMVLALAVGLIAVMNPYGNLPLDSQHEPVAFAAGAFNHCAPVTVRDNSSRILGSH